MSSAGISIQMYTLRDFTKTRADLITTLAKVAAIGYRTVQISIPAWLTAPELQDLLVAAGLRADSVMAPTATVPAKLAEIVRTAEILGTDVVRTDGIPGTYTGTEAGFGEYAAILQRSGSLLHDAGLKFMYHNHAIEYTNFDDCTGMDILLRQTDPACVMFQPDVHHIAAAGLEPSRALAAFRGRCDYVHMQGYAIIPGEGFDHAIPRRTVPVGTGNLNWAGIVQACREIGVRLYVAEQDYCIGNPFDEISQSFQALRAMDIDA